jgi:hypothetical protein
LEIGLAILSGRERIAQTPALVMGRKTQGKSRFIGMRITSNAIRTAGTVLILLAALTLVGCSVPYATVTLKPFSDTAAYPEIIGPDLPEIQDALAIIDSVLTKNGYVTEAGWVSGGSTSKGWYLERSYVFKKPNVYVTVYHEGTKQPSAISKAGKGSVEIHVEFQESDGWFVKMHPDVVRVQNEIAEELAKRFGKEKITIFDGRQGLSELM